MTFDKKILAPILRELRAKRLRVETEAAERRAKIYDEIPRIAEIDIDLKTTILDIIKSAFNTNSDAAPMLGAVRERNLALQAERAELLVASGYAYDYLEPRFECPRCGDTGYLDGEPCDCLKEKYLKEHAKELNRILMVGEESFDNFKIDYYSKERIDGRNVSPYEQMEEVYDFCVGYAKHFGRDSGNLFMTGASGLGKTLLSSCIARVVAENGASVVYDTAFRIFAAFEDDKFNRDSDFGGGVHRYQECDLLVLDDLGTEMITAFTVAALYNLINTRLMCKKKTIINSTLSLSEIRRKYNEQIYSRIAGEYITLTFLGDDIRSKKRN